MICQTKQQHQQHKKIEKGRQKKTMKQKQILEDEINYTKSVNKTTYNTKQYFFTQN